MKRLIFAIALIVLLVYIAPLNLRPLVDPDETRYAEVPREMIANCDYVVPKLAGVLYFEKPVMGYWLNAVSMKIFGENHFAVRFPQALSVILTALGIFFLARRFGNGTESGLAATLVYLSSVQVFAVGVFNTLDSALSLFLTGSLGAFFMAWDQRDNEKRFRLFLALAGLFCGLAIHTKGFLALVVPASVIVPFLAWEGRFKEVFRIPWIPLIVAGLVMLPWGILVHLKEQEYWYFFFWHEHVRRFMAEDAQHIEPFYYFIPVLLGGFLPHTVLAPAAIGGFILKGFDTSFKKFLVCWSFFPFLFFSASSGKLATYILPCFPPLAMLMAQAVRDALDRGNDRQFKRGIFVLMGLVLSGVVAALGFQYNLFGTIGPIYADNSRIVLFLAGMAAYLAFLAAALRAKQPFTRIILFALSPFLLYAVAHVLTPDRALIRKSPTVFIEKHLPLFDGNPLIVAPSTPIKAVCWSLKRDDIFLLDDGGELRYGFRQKNVKHRQLFLKDFKRMVEENRGKRRVVLVLDERRFTMYGDKLPDPSDIIKDAEDGFMLAIYR